MRGACAVFHVVVLVPHYRGFSTYGIAIQDQRDDSAARKTKTKNAKKENEPNPFNAKPDRGQLFLAHGPDGVYNLVSTYTKPECREEKKTSKKNEMTSGQNPFASPPDRNQLIFEHHSGSSYKLVPMPAANPFPENPSLEKLTRSDPCNKDQPNIQQLKKHLPTPQSEAHGFWRFKIQCF